MNAAVASLFARAAFVHHGDQGHDALKHYVVLTDIKEEMEEKPPASQSISDSLSPRIVSFISVEVQ